ncbi:hypothetical protein WIW50_15635 [Flavobacteriaceae bacterium 3-367]|uniref:alpha/beta hydrolase n=1 Tax=Eudoraea algarum TaxID=3417568 RepID=UPI00328AA915
MKEFKNINTIQKISIVFIAIGAMSIFPEHGTWFHKTLQTLFVVGLLFYIYPIKRKMFNSKIKKTTLILIFSIGSMGLNAQDYSEQIESFNLSFDEKDLGKVNKHLSSELKFDPIPASKTPMIMKNIVTKLPKLNSIKIIESEKGKAKVKYDFVGLGIRESRIHFDEEDKITKIELIENPIRQEMEAQKAMKKSMQQPNTNGLSSKFEKIQFKSIDNLMVTGNLYEISKENPIILLCHQAGYNKFEYADIAPRLNQLGFNVLAIDQRAGGEFAGHKNETNTLAKQKGYTNLDFLDAEQDIITAIDYLTNRYSKKIVLWGSSYSSSLAFIIGMENENVMASIAFSPGNYFGDKRPLLENVLSKSKKPFFITSSKNEAQEIKRLLLKDVPKGKERIHFTPNSEGFHGSRVLWVGQTGAEEYWSQIRSFLDNYRKI